MPESTTADEPVAERIVLFAVDALALIQTENGYRHDVLVMRGDPNGVARGNGSAGNLIVVRVGQVLVANDVAPITKDGYRMVLFVDFTVARSADAETPSETLMNRLDADVRRCLCRNFQFGGLAFNSTLQATQPGQDGSLPTLTIPVEVLFWTKRDDPFVP
jgi:hypothetical protein